MTGAFGYAAAILVAALALRRLPVELSRWRLQRRSRLLAGGRGDAEGVPGPRADRKRRPAPSRSAGPLRRRLRRALHDAAVDCGDSQAVTVWATAVAVGCVGGMLLAATPGAVIGAGAGLVGPAAALWAARHRRARLVVEALPDFLERVARSLRAGVSTVAALEEALPATGPLSEDLRRVLADVLAGSTLAAALDRWCSRCALPEVNLASAALAIGASTGGRRAPAADGVAATLRGTRATRREVASLAQQGRMSGLLVALLPVCFLGLSAMIDRDSVSALYGTPLGFVCLLAGGTLNVVAFVWMHRITRLP
ncbi:MAG: type II secretion system F family protein [bacterium]|nr:type II secretion system F family protein [bacterium]